jgi:hypothetical protein
MQSPLVRTAYIVTTNVSSYLGNRHHHRDPKPYIAMRTNPNDPTHAPFEAASEAGNLSLVQQLSVGRSLTDGSMNFGLYRALEDDHDLVVRELLKRGVKIDQTAIKLRFVAELLPSND